METKSAKGEVSWLAKTLAKGLADCLVVDEERTVKWTCSPRRTVMVGRGSLIMRRTKS